ncbi:MAG: hypothetical protein AAF270_05415, partial [Pseudomonadota bacterium]
MNIRQIIFDRRRFYWTLNLAGWSGFVTTAYIGALAHEKPDAYFTVIAGTALTGFLFTIPIRALYHRLWSQPPMRIAFGSLIICFFFALAWVLIENELYWILIKHGWHPDNWFNYFGGVMGSFYILL